jgi:hypothetical protein
VNLSEKVPQEFIQEDGVTTVAEATKDVQASPIAPAH